ncbi:regulatory protein (GGDEF and EAL domains) [Legionella lansingensis]|uniref:Regulatory protein (GGDEF and EAL domains) n=1 Tax=Legionella lansingensis TaxID=45067 RepID=A0A0W0V775_9GAMM|nr:EAL domain-containing protein [Legionella lansingensis]KTD15985.1 regulatory protein (GGDEF and EAL domains) [Legionella lansingensis]SNV56466.1 regulatory protein (GGDEF and EAL domains) [Legionella lansingensis]
MRAATKNVKILIIDDNPAIHSDFIKILTTKNSSDDLELANFEQKVLGKKNQEPTLPAFRLVTATQGQEGVEKISQAVQENDPYALAFVDIRMPPGWDGIETAKKIWEIDPNIQIVICTAYSDYSWEETIQHLGQRENLLILKKPFDSIAVRQLSCALTKKWQLLQQNREYTQLLEQQVKERTQSLQESLSVTRGTLESSADGILVMNNNEEIIDFNANLVNMFKVPNRLMNTQKAGLVLEYIAERLEKSEHFLKLTEKMTHLKNTTKTTTLKCKDSRILDIYTQPYKLNKKICGRIWCFRDITKRALLEEQLQYQATHDSLTELPNRVLLTDRLAQLISHAKRNKSNFCVLFLDIDRFKLINDSFSHTAGDKLLKDVVERIRHVMREEDTLARLGGDEFVAVLKSLKDETHAGKIAKKLLAVFTEPFNVSSHQILITASAGIATFPHDGQTINELLRNADIAMYRAKEQGGNQFQFYTYSLGKKSAARMELESELYKAFENQEFFLCYQPQLDVATQRLISVEALIRWRHPTKGIILPINFMPLVEETGLIIPIGEWVLREACSQNKKWQELGLPKIRVAVNIASKQLKQPNFTKFVRNILKETHLDPEYLELEVTEKVILHNTEAAAIFCDLKQMGIHLALDDFGSGYTILNHLKSFPIDRVKIDQSYIDHIRLNQADEILVQAIIALAKNLNLEVVAEGVVSKEQIDFLENHQCTEAQGFYFCKPLISKEFENFLKKTKY